MIVADTLWKLIERRAEATPEAPFAFDEEDRALSFAGYREAAQRAAAGLQARGVVAESRVTWVLPTRLQTMVLSGALARLGAIQNPVLPIYREREVGFVVHQTAAQLLVVPPAWRGFDYPAMARKLAAGRRELAVLVLGGSLPEADPSSLPAVPPPLAPDAAPVRWHFYTSGTTADPKGARHTDVTLMASAKGMVEALEIEASDRHGLVFPITHVGGIGWLIAGLMSGCAQVPVAIFDPATAIDRLTRHGVTLAGAGTAFHQAYLAARRADPLRPLLPAVRAFPGGGAPKPPVLHADLKSAFGGVGIVSGYGLTECPIISMNSVRDPDEQLAHTEGRPRPAGAEIRVIGPDGGRVGPGVEGELRIRGPQLFRGYVDAALDADAFDADGFFRTGDLGMLDPQGYVVITGRLKDVIVRKGENISAKELEDLLYTHPSVADVAVIGLPDPALGERCCAVVALAPDARLTLEEVAAYLRERGLMIQKIPEQLELVAELPRNAAGKVTKQALRERFSRASA